MPNWLGAIRAIKSFERQPVVPLGSPALLRLAFRLTPEERKRELLHYRIVARCAPELLPLPLKYLGSYFRRAPVTGFFFLTMGLSAGTWIWLVAEAQRSATELSTGWVLLASLLGLAIVEHVLMVFALPLQRLWGWALQAKPDHV